LIQAFVTLTRAHRQEEQVVRLKEETQKSRNKL